MEQGKAIPPYRKIRCIRIENRIQEGDDDLLPVKMNYQYDKIVKYPNS